MATIHHCFELFQNLEKSLAKQGWAITTASQFESQSFDHLILSIANQLGIPRVSRRGGALIDHLVPTASTQAHPNSLSAKYGTKAFPWHIDGSHWPTPPRYLVFGCVNSSSTSASTHILDRFQVALLNGIEAKTYTFLVKNSAKSFYTTVASDLRPFIRYDPGCMYPLDSRGHELQRNIEEVDHVKTKQIIWEPGTIAIIDNWRCLHKRSNIYMDNKRHLLRATIMDR